MTSPIQQNILDMLSHLCELSPDVRVGQLLAHLAFLAEDRTDQTLWDLDDQQLLDLLKEHRDELSRRNEHVA